MGAVPPYDQQMVLSVNRRCSVSHLMSESEVEITPTRSTLVRSHACKRSAHHGGCLRQVTAGTFMKLLGTVLLRFNSYHIVHINIHPERRGSPLFERSCLKLLPVLDEFTSGGNEAGCTMKKPKRYRSHAMEVSNLCKYIFGAFTS